MPIGLPHRNSHPSIRPSIADRVVDEVDQHLPQHRPVAFDDDGAVRFQTDVDVAPQRLFGMAIIDDALFAGPVLGIILKECIETAERFFDHGAACRLVGLEREGG